MSELVKKLRSYPSATCKDEDIAEAADLIEKINIDKIVLEELKQSYRETIRIDDDEALLSALNTVISYYSTHEEYQEWMVEKMNLSDRKREKR